MSEDAAQIPPSDAPGPSTTTAAAATFGAGLNLVKDIPVTLSIELGRARMTLKELLELDQGAVVELDRMVDEPMDILVNGTLVAHGEVVVIDDTFGVRLTDVANPDGAQVLGG